MGLRGWIRDAAKEAIWLRDLLQELKFCEKITPILNQDNQGAIVLQKNHSLKQRTKHIDIKAHYIRERVKAGDIAIRYCRTEDMVADIFTKPLIKSIFIKHRKSILNMKDEDRVNSEEECQQ
jgi:KUP system potassium uptake protein